MATRKHDGSPVPMTANWEAILCILCSEPKDCGLICSCINGRLPTGIGWETLVLKIPGRGGVRQLYALFILSVFFFLSMPLPLEWVVEVEGYHDEMHATR